MKPRSFSGREVRQCSATLASAFIQLSFNGFGAYSGDGSIGCCRAVSTTSVSIGAYNSM
ncbi:hypothetical protein D3C84_1205020 [compost metagenome]